MELRALYNVSLPLERDEAKPRPKGAAFFGAAAARQPRNFDHPSREDRSCETYPRRSSEEITEEIKTR